MVASPGSSALRNFIISYLKAPHSRAVRKQWKSEAEGEEEEEGEVGGRVEKHSTRFCQNRALEGRAIFPESPR